MKIPIVSVKWLAENTLNYFDPDTGQFVIAPNTPEHRAKKEASGKLLIWQNEDGDIVIAQDTPENRKEYDRVKQAAV